MRPKGRAKVVVQRQLSRVHFRAILRAAGGSGVALCANFRLDGIFKTVIKFQMYMRSCGRTCVCGCGSVWVFTGVRVWQRKCKWRMQIDLADTKLWLPPPTEKCQRGDFLCRVATWSQTEMVVQSLP